MKIATIFFVHFGLSIVVLGIGIVQDVIVHIAVNHAVGDLSKAGIFDKNTHRQARVKETIATIFLYIIVVVIGTVGFGLMFKDHPLSESDDPFLDGLYLTVITLTTVGFGDISPLDDGTKVLSCLLMLFGIPIFAAAFGMINHLIYPEANSATCLQKVQGKFSMEKFQSIQEFVDEMREQGIGNYRDQGEGKISRFEYLAFILVENGTVEMRNIKNVMTNFDAIDVSKEGFISMSDVGASVGKSSSSL
jgi:hypothetical protein